ncbi:hypothetical protein BDN67DRAFT_1014168 [Paxillus ammoniavirescens]|nr:hypothetical protein BDN67DRAFT_1014168 [Paxillus ammoniavirescens]
MVDADDDHLSGSLSHPHHFDEYMEDWDQLAALNDLIFPDSELGALGLRGFDTFYPVSDNFETTVTTSSPDWMEVVKSKVENALILFVMLRFQATKNLLYDIEEFRNDSVVIPATVGLLPSKAVVIPKSSEWKTYMTRQLGWHDNMQHGAWIMHHVMYVKGPDTGLQEEHVKFLQDERFDAVIKHLLFNTGLFSSIGRCTQCGSAFLESVLRQDLTDVCAWITTTAKIVFLGGYDGEAPPDTFYEVLQEERKNFTAYFDAVLQGLTLLKLQRVAPVPQRELSPWEAAEYFRKTYRIKALGVLLAQHAQVTLDHLTSHHFIKWWEADDIARVVDTFSKDFNEITLESSQRLSKGCMVDQAV